MIFSKQSSSYVLDAFAKSMQWIKNNTINGKGIIHSSSLKKAYPEVTGYYIPSLLNWGENDLACAYGDWLVSIQTPEGAWQELELKTIYTFDTGQILKGLYNLIPFDEKYEKAFLKGCDWLVKQIDQEGRVLTPDTSCFTSIGNENIHLYALEPLKLAAEKYNNLEYLTGFNRALNYYLNTKDLTTFKVISHFHAYVVEALIDLGCQTQARAALDSLKQYKKLNGIVPAFYNKSWVCLPAVLQYAVCYYKLGMLQEGNTFLNYAISKQNDSGGFYGGYGWFTNYFKNIEISWALKYLLDAIHLKLKLEFQEPTRAENFLPYINKIDGRYILLKEIVELIAKSHKEVSLLDVGCGKGRFIHNILAEGFNINVTAMDISDKLFKYLPSKCEKKIGNICQMPLQNNIYDIVFCCETLEHAINIEAAIKELSRVCKLGGIVVIIDKSLSRKKNIRLEVWEQWFEPTYIASLMQKNNLMVEVKELSTTDGPPICSWVGRKEQIEKYKVIS